MLTGCLSLHNTLSAGVVKSRNNLRINYGISINNLTLYSAEEKFQCLKKTVQFRHIQQHSENELASHTRSNLLKLKMIPSVLIELCR